MALLVCRQSERFEVRVARGRRIPPPIIVIDDSIEGGQASVMHVGRCAIDLSECGCLERAAVLRRSSDEESAKVFPLAALPGYTRVMEALVAHGRTRMAGRASRFTSKDLESTPGLVRERVRDPVRIPIEWRVSPQDRSHIAGESTRDPER